jgi:hypothetical protein
MNLTGFVQALLLNIVAIAGSNDPQTKVTPTGFLQMLLEHGANAEVVNIDALRRGREQTIKIRYMQRGIESEVTDVDDCEAPIVPAWEESEIKRGMFSKIGLHIDDDMMRKLQNEALTVVSPGMPPTPLYSALYQTLRVKLNGLIQAINTNLLKAQTTAWGVNAQYGTHNAQTLQFGGKMGFDNGIVKLILDAQMNEINEDVIIVGNGVVNAFQVLNGMKAGVDYQGYGRAQFKVYNDIKSTSVWGANHFGVFAKGLTAFVDFNKNVQSFAGERGGAYFFTIPIPMDVNNGALSTLVLDAQLQYDKCPVYDETGTKIADRGWVLLLGKHYGLWNAPGNMFAASDRLNGFNGSLHYIGAQAPDCIKICED